MQRLAVGDRLPPELTDHAEVREYLSNASLVLVHFWSLSCPFCTLNLPTVSQLSAEYAADGLRVIAVHSPIADGETTPEALETVKHTALGGLPVADYDHNLCTAFGADGVRPAYFLFKANTGLKRRSTGLGGLKWIEAALKSAKGYSKSPAEIA